MNRLISNIALMVVAVACAAGCSSSGQAAMGNNWEEVPLPAAQVDESGFETFMENAVSDSGDEPGLPRLNLVAENHLKPMAPLVARERISYAQLVERLERAQEMYDDSALVKAVLSRLKTELNSGAPGPQLAADLSALTEIIRENCAENIVAAPVLDRVAPRQGE